MPLIGADGSGEVPVPTRLLHGRRARWRLAGVSCRDRIACGIPAPRALRAGNETVIG